MIRAWYADLTIGPIMPELTHDLAAGTKLPSALRVAGSSGHEAAEQAVYLVRGKGEVDVQIGTSFVVAVRAENETEVVFFDVCVKPVSSLRAITAGLL